MKYFVCLLDTSGLGIPREAQCAYEAIPRARGQDFRWESCGHAAVLTAWDEPYGDSMVTRFGQHTGIGVVRLDNRPDLECWAEDDCRGLTDLDVVLRVIVKHGAKYIPAILGDFGFLVWDEAKRSAIGACDAFAVRRLYYAGRNGMLVFASRAESLAHGQRYDLDYLVRLLALHASPQDRTIYDGVKPVPAASMAVVTGTSIRLEEYWTPRGFDIEHTWEKSEEEAAETYQTLLAQSVSLRLGGSSDSWAQLSGGLDSSAVVSLVQWLAERGKIGHGLTGTVTYVDRQGTAADERPYSDTVVKRWGLRNEVVVDPPTWQDHTPPPLTDQPGFDLQVYPRERGVCAAVTKAGGRVLLTGWGGDELLMGSMLYFADWIVRGRVCSAAREMLRLAAIGRVSFWTLAYRNGLGPLLPAFLQQRLLHDEFGSPVQPWLGRSVLKRHGVTLRNRLAPEYAGPPGQKYRHAVAAKIASLPAVAEPGILADALDVRHPMLYRPLVEFALRLPPSLRARPHAQRWILRQSMRGILPEEIRTRVGKPDTGAALACSLVSGRSYLTELLRKPILADLGVVDARALRKAFECALIQSGRGDYLHAHLQATLAVEAWLQARRSCSAVPGQCHAS